jgi:hypothetical protein
MFGIGVRKIPRKSEMEKYNGMLPLGRTKVGVL